MNRSSTLISTLFTKGSPRWIFVPLLVFSLFSASPFVYASEDEPIFDLMSIGYMTGSIYAQPQQTRTLAGLGMRGLYTLEGTFLQDYGLKVSLEYYSNLAGLGETVNRVSTANANRLSYSVAGNDWLAFMAEVKEAWIDMAAGDFDIRLGKQIMAWGQADGNNPTDTLNARHVGTRFLSTLDEQKMGAYAANVTYYLPDNAGTIQGIFMPQPSRVDLPSIAMDQTYGTTRMIIEEDQDAAYTASNSELGVRGLFYLGALSISGSLFTYIDRYPDFSYTFIPGMPTVITLTSEHYRINQLGFDFVWLVDGWDIRSEWALNKTTDTDGSDPLVKNSSVSGVVQVSRSFMDSALTASVAWAPRRVLDFKPLSEYSTTDQYLASQIRKYDGQAYEKESIYTVRLAGKFYNETLQPEIMYLMENSAQDWFLSASVAYNISDGMSVKFGGTIYDSFLAAGDTAREYGTFSKSSIIDDDYIYAELKYSF